MNGIFQLLKGQPAAFFALMEKKHARHKQSLRWSHLLLHTLDGLKEKPLSYLLEILHHLRGINMGGVHVLELQVYDPAVKHESVLELLNALFKQFDRYGGEEITKAVSGMFTDELMTEKEFSENLQQLSQFLVNLLQFLLDTEDEVDVVKAYFVCFNRVLKFEYEGKIQDILSKDEVAENLQNLRTKYSLHGSECDIETNFHDISIKLAKCKYEFQIQKLNAEICQLKAQNQQLLLTVQNLQLEAQLQEEKDVTDT